MPGQNTPQRPHGRGAARTAVVWEALREVLESVPVEGAGADRVSVVDVGGGTGGFAVRVAELGHRVTVVDPSPDALAILGLRADESGVADLVTARQGDLASLPDLVPAANADVVLCHGVLEIVDDPVEALSVLAGTLRPGGVLSLLVNQRHAAVVARAMAGHFQQARTLLDDPAAAGSTRRFTANEISEVLTGTGFEVTAMHAVRVFVDLVPSSLVDLEPGADSALVELERAVADRPEYLPLGTQLHVLALRR
ncbi:MAG TPA: methyltransferase domain-containing protein [Nocardioidaceae bacterium]|nr:methyltransferase domain-containing protein [Nocardioidaceae bacterium]